MTIIADLSALGDRLLTSKEVAILFRVDPKTVARWAAKGQLPALRTPGGRELRFYARAVYEALRNGAITIADAEAVA
ncbi:helix-turn-helix domain-containing protein [Nonomuraea sp. NPDC049714]|uniref:helix-turn-helix domain-containing protein n=1 Tax=Nonomuraea sp. NPDC049714 TaxID=3364357 RepID=UPI0037947DB7